MKEKQTQKGKTMTKTELVNRYNELGIFPTDEELFEVVKSDSNYSDMFELEMELIELAISDTNHPYHLMVTDGL
jgi:hypothetical protein